MKKTFLIFSVLIVFIASSCYYDKEELLYGSNCDTANVTYSTTIKGILNNYSCLGCHVGTNPSGGINLETHVNVKAQALSGKLYGAVSHSPGFVPMPDGAAKMSPCDINKVKAWIDAGAPDN
ncbi:MAG TPA: hypothetical protein VNS32_10195 [Flavisolibacter sp.]|nr:hypothetical protein [Flavisolibacter sp.]